MPENKPAARWSALPLRLIVGYGFAAHGYAKLARGPDVFIDILHAIGVPFPTLMGWATIGVELLGGVAVLLGAFVAWISVPMAIILLVAAFTVHLPNGFSSIKLLSITSAGAEFGQPGYETDLLYLACLAALVLGGAGPFALDGMGPGATKNASDSAGLPCETGVSRALSRGMERRSLSTPEVDEPEVEGGCRRVRDVFVPLPLPK